MSARVLSYLGRFLELRLRAFVYAMFTLVGFILGVMVANDMALSAIAELEAHTLQQIKAAKS